MVLVGSLVSIYFDSPRVGIQKKKKKKLYKALDYRSIVMSNFEYVEKGLGIVSSPHVVYDFSK